MNQCKADDIRKFILDRYSNALRGKGLAPEEVPDDYDLLAGGVIDSLGILEMISAVEDLFDVELDLQDLDSDDLTRVGPFSRFVEKITAPTPPQDAG